MGGGKNDQPDPPDYRGAAEESAESSANVIRQQTYANRPTQNTPWGSMDWTTGSVIDPSTGKPTTQWTQDMTLNPASQRALDDQMRLTEQRSGLAGGMYDRMAGEFGQPIDFGGANPLQTGPEAGSFDSSSRYYDEAGDAIYGQFERRMEPRFAQQKAAMETQLRNQGLVPGTEAYDYQLNQMQQQQEDSRQGAAYQSTIGAGQEAQRMLGMDMGAQGQEFAQGMQGAGFGNQVRQQEISEEMQRRGYTLNEINAILTGQQVQQPNMPSFNAAAASQPADYLGAARSQGEFDIGAYGAGQAQSGGMMSGLAGMGASALGGPMGGMMFEAAFGS